MGREILQIPPGVSLLMLLLTPPGSPAVATLWLFAGAVVLATAPVGRGLFYLPVISIAMGSPAMVMGCLKLSGTMRC
jgi:hypothetical protein